MKEEVREGGWRDRDGSRAERHGGEVADSCREVVEAGGGWRRCGTHETGRRKETVERKKKGGEEGRRCRR
jgi:hypothetical protein